MPLTKLENLISSKTGRYLYVSPDDFNASDALDNRGNSPTRPFLTIQRAFLEVGRYSYVPGQENDRFDQFTIMLSPGNHYIDNRPGVENPEEIAPFAYNQATQENGKMSLLLTSAILITFCTSLMVLMAVPLFLEAPRFGGYGPS